MTGLGLQCFLLVLSTTFAAGKAYSYATVLSAEAQKYVDLGLSVKWATSNIGASKPEELGDYYACAIDFDNKEVICQASPVDVEMREGDDNW